MCIMRVYINGSLLYIYCEQYQETFPPICGWHCNKVWTLNLELPWGAELCGRFDDLSLMVKMPDGKDTFHKERMIVTGF